MNWKHWLVFWVFWFIAIVLTCTGKADAHGTHLEGGTGPFGATCHINGTQIIERLDCVNKFHMTDNCRVKDYMQIVMTPEGDYSFGHHENAIHLLRMWRPMDLDMDTLPCQGLRMMR